MYQSANSSEVARIHLGDGRAVSYAEEGKRNGTPVLFFHGTPGSRCFRHPQGSIAEDVGAWVIHFDRPGFGHSNLKPHRSLFDCARDAAELMNALNIRKFFVAGVSGGAPHALTCAFAMPDRVQGAAIVSSLAPPDHEKEIRKGMSTMNRMGLWIARAAPFLLRPALSPMARRAQSDPEALLRQVEPNYSEPDRRTMSQPEVRRMFVQDITESYRQGSVGHADDLRAVSQPWGFGLNEIRVPVQVWHGEEDVNVPLAMGDFMARSIPTAKLSTIPDAGHLVVLDHWKEILENMLSDRQ